MRERLHVFEIRWAGLVADDRTLLADSNNLLAFELYLVADKTTLLAKVKVSGG